MKNSGLILCLITLGLLALNWLLTIGLIYLVCLLFKVTFSLSIATGIWIIKVLLKVVEGRDK